MGQYGARSGGYRGYYPEILRRPIIQVGSLRESPYRARLVSLVLTDLSEGFSGIGGETSNAI